MGGTKFHTEVVVPVFRHKTGYDQKSLFMGSCFTENIGQKMEDLKFPVDINPFGILYNPFSVARGLELLLNPKEFLKADLVEHGGLWHSFLHHGRFSGLIAEEVLSGVNSRLQTSAAFLQEASFLFLTFGTSWVYRLNSTSEIVANCHKIPAREFTRERVSVEQIVSRYLGLLDTLWQKNPELQVVFTVSPIRHWKDGAIENQRSKATLLLAVEALVQRFPERCSYFPSYEIVMDELRDYRYYAADMLHLSEVAVDHIWSVFENSLIDEPSRNLSLEVQRIVRAVKHRPINQESGEYRIFLNKFLQITTDLEQRHSYLNLKLEKEYFIRSIHNLSDRSEQK